MPKIDRDGVGIYYEVHGDGPPLLLTHGYSSTSAMWHGQVDALSRDHKLILWDMRGHGQSDYPDDPKAYSEALTVGDIAALLDTVGARRAIVARSKAYATDIRVGSLQRGPKKDMPIGRTPWACPAGTVTLGYPAIAAAPDDPTKSVKSSPFSRSVTQAGPFVGATIASSR